MTSMDKLEEYVNRLDAINKQVDELACEKEALCSELAYILGPATHEIGGHKIQISYPKRVDRKALEANYPEHDYPEYYTSSVSATKVKKDIGENLYQKYTVESDKPVVKLA